MNYIKIDSLNQINRSCCVCGRNLRGATSFRKDNKIFCQDDIKRVMQAQCSACGSYISDDNVFVFDKYYHQSCFFCHLCGVIFKPGMRVTMWKRKFYCSICFNACRDETSECVKTKTKQTTPVSNVSNQTKGDLCSFYCQELANKLAAQYTACEKHISDGKPSKNGSGDLNDHVSKNEKLPKNEPKSIASDELPRTKVKDKNEGLLQVELKKSRSASKTFKSSEQIQEKAQNRENENRFVQKQRSGKVASIVQLIEEKVKELDSSFQNSDPATPTNLKVIEGETPSFANAIQFGTKKPPKEHETIRDPKQDGNSSHAPNLYKTNDPLSVERLDNPNIKLTSSSTPCQNHLLFKSIQSVGQVQKNLSEVCSDSNPKPMTTTPLAHSKNDKILTRGNLSINYLPVKMLTERTNHRLKKEQGMKEQGQAELVRNILHYGQLERIHPNMNRYSSRATELRGVNVKSRCSRLPNILTHRRKRYVKQVKRYHKTQSSKTILNSENIRSYEQSGENANFGRIMKRLVLAAFMLLGLLMALAWIAEHQMEGKDNSTLSEIFKPQPPIYVDVSKTLKPMQVRM